jgi:mannose-1-phosphate guanylyltransferase
MPNALILVGGFGTRLRPLTFDFPKPLVPFANEEILLHQIRSLAKVGVKRVVLAVAKPQPGQPNQKEAMSGKCHQWEQQFGLKIVFSEESTPLGTAGPIRLARDELLADNADGKMFVLNSDITCMFPLGDLLKFHNDNNASGTIMVTPVENPSRYGVILSDDIGRINRFVEKPKTFVGNRINAGIYCLNVDIIDKYITKQGPMSIEREVFPNMASDNVLYAIDLIGHWADIGKSEDYLIGLNLFLNSHNSHERPAGNYETLGHVLIADDVQIGDGCVIGPNVTINSGSKIGPCSRIANSALFSDVVVGKGAYVDKSIVSNFCKLGDWSRVEGSVLGQRISVGTSIELKTVEAANNISINEHAANTKVWC